MKIIDQKTFLNNLEDLEELKRAEGHLNESIICLVDYIIKYLDGDFTKDQDVCNV